MTLEIMRDNLIYAAFDPSSVAVGYCLAQGDRYITSGTFKPHNDRSVEANLRAEKRLRGIYLWASDFFENHDVDLVALEIPAGNHGNRRTDRLLARAGGMIEAAAFRWGMTAEDILRVYPSQVKATGIHKTNLQQARFEKARGIRLSGQTPPPVNEISIDGDEADAIGVWRHVFMQQRQSNLMQLSRVRS